MNKKIFFPQINGILHGSDYNPDQWLDRPDILEKDIELMKKASKFLIGKHNFKAFATFDDDVKNFDRQINSIDIKQEGNIFSFEINGNAFLYNMVRIIVGTLLDVGTGKIKPEDVKKILDSKDRRNAGKLVPPHPLCLIKVYY